MNLYRVLLITVLMSLVGITALAQESEVEVPNLTSLSVPQAVAALNAAGLRLGSQNNIAWTEASGLPQGSVSAQAIEAGTRIATGASVDVTVLRSPNMLLIYDDNDLTLVNQSGKDIALGGLQLNTIEGTAATLAGSRWATNLRSNQCVQAWSVSRNGPKSLNECATMQNWLVTTNPAEHAWTQANGVQRFAVLENGIERAICPAAPPNSQDNPLHCTFFYSAGVAADFTDYVYLAYTATAVAIINSSENQWMATNRVRIFNFNPQIAVLGAELNMGEPSLYNNVNPVADITRLAPRQCIVMVVNANASGTSPEPCNVIAELVVSPEVAFWLAGFEVQSSSDGQRRRCPQATEGRTTLCILLQ